MSEKFALKWNDFQSNWNKSLSHLRKDTDFADVTLISDDKVKFLAHKIILSACSNMFKMILKVNIHGSPLLYLGGVSSVNLQFILDYMYHGEVNLFQEQLDSFLESAQKLEIEGLMGQENMNQETLHENSIANEEQNDFTKAEPRQLIKMNDNDEVITRKQYARQPSNVARIDASSLSQKEINEKIKELYQKTDGGWSCLSCDFTSTDKSSSSNMRRHVETHIDGLSYKCNLCSKEFRLRNSFNVHKNTVHKF